ncbi:MAG: AMP-binding protein, partial [Actinomycetota bacterium]|nr:AMP-binding protein [Actinomycetota bacterium]
PDHIAIQHADGAVTYRELNRRAEGLAAGFAASGVASGDRIALLASNSAQYLQVLLGCSRIGATLVPINVRLIADEIRFQAEDANSRFAVIDPALVSVATDAGLFERTVWQTGSELNELADHHVGRAVLPRPDARSTLTQLYTSGTTGRPKGCLLSESAWLAAISNQIMGFGFRDSDVVTIANPLFHVSGVGQALTAFAVGGTVVLPASPSAEDIWASCREHGVTVAAFPAGLATALQHPAAAESGTSLRMVLGGAGMEKVETLNLLAEKLPSAEFAGIYGSTEAGGYSTRSTLDDEVSRPGTIGRPLPLTDAILLDDVGAQVEVGAVGELALRGASTMAGYWNLPAETTEATRDNWLRTGDLMRSDEDGYLYFVGRSKEMVKPGGENVYTIEVEQALLKHPRVSEVAVIGVPDERWGEAVKAVVVVNGPVEPQELDAWCLGRLAPYKRPRWYEFRENTLPRTAMGKVPKAELRAGHDPRKSIRLGERDREATEMRN